MSKTPSQTPTPATHTTAKLDPRTVSLSDYQRYQSYEMRKLAASLRSYRKSLLYIGGTLAFSLVFAWIGNKTANEALFGRDYRGGSYLNLRTLYDEDHYAYNREFQRMHVLGQAKIGDSSRHSKQLLKDLGVDLQQKGAPHVLKRPPHQKFY